MRYKINRYLRPACDANDGGRQQSFTMLMAAGALGVLMIVAVYQVKDFNKIADCKEMLKKPQGHEERTIVECEYAVAMWEYRNPRGNWVSGVAREIGH